MPWKKLPKSSQKGNKKYVSSSGKKWSLGMIRAYLAKKKKQGIKGV